jgi:hypothetical protein
MYQSHEVVTVSDVLLFFSFFILFLCFTICPDAYLVNFSNTLLLYYTRMAALSGIPSYSLPILFL